MHENPLRGKIHKIWDINVVSEKFQKREFVVEVNSSNQAGTFIEYIKMQTVQEKCHILDGIHTGDLVIVRWDLAGRKWGKKPNEQYFTNVECLEIDVITKSNISPEDDAIEEAVPLGEEDHIWDLPKDEIPDPDEPDDLPF